MTPKGHPHPTYNCDGCGRCVSYVATVDRDVPEEHGGGSATYCIGCDDLLDRRGVDPGDHDQYMLPDQS